MRQYLDVLRNTEIVRFIHRHKNWIITILIPIALTAIIEYQTGYLGDKLYDCFNGLEYSEGIITPLYFDDALEVSEARKYAESYGKKRLDEGCILNIYVHNNKENPIIVSETSIVIDDVEKIIEPKFNIIGVYSEIDNIFSLYAINNGLGTLDNNKIQIVIDYYDIEKQKQIECKKEEMELFLQGKNVLYIQNLVGGEIRKIGTFNLKKEKVEKIGQIMIGYDIIDGEEKKTERIHNPIGAFYYVDSKILFSAGDGWGEDTVQRSLLINVDGDKGYELNVPANFKVDGNDWKNIFYALYPTSSCRLTFHAKLKTANKKKEIETEKFIQDIYVPLYKEEGGFFESIREFVARYDIDTYYYNSNIFIQKEIDYVPVIDNQKEQTEQ